MKFALKQKFWSWGDDFTITDEQGRDCYVVDGEVFSFGDSLAIRDLSGNVVAQIEQRLLSWGPTYEIHRPGKGATQVRKEVFTFSPAATKSMVPVTKTTRPRATSLTTNTNSGAADGWWHG